MKKIKIHRDSGTGQYVTPEYAEQNKLTTQSETIVVLDKQIEDVSAGNTQSNKVFPSEVISKQKPYIH